MNCRQPAVGGRSETQLPTGQTFTLVCFALKQEAAPFRRLAGGRPGIQILITGVGPRNARETVQRALGQDRPGFLFTCGFAGGLDPALPFGRVVFETDEGHPLAESLKAAGARPGRFHCASRIAWKAIEKRALRNDTGADAVEMESGVIRHLCREHGIPSATVRVISDTAAEDLPLDFNSILSSTQELSLGRLARAVVSAPGQIPALIRFQRRVAAAARALADLLLASLGPDRR